MKFEYQNYGDLVYGVEDYWFRYNNHHGATIKVLDFLTDKENEFVYQFKIEDDIEIPSRYKECSSADHVVRSEFNFFPPGTFSSRQEALQDAVSIISAILDKYSSISPSKEKQNQS